MLESYRFGITHMIGLCLASFKAKMTDVQYQTTIQRILGLRQSE